MQQKESRDEIAPSGSIEEDFSLPPLSQIPREAMDMILSVVHPTSQSDLPAASMPVLEPPTQIENTDVLCALQHTEQTDPIVVVAAVVSPLGTSLEHSTMASNVSMTPSERMDAAAASVGKQPEPSHTSETSDPSYPLCSVEVVSSLHDTNNQECEKKSEAVTRRPPRVSLLSILQANGTAIGVNPSTNVRNVITNTLELRADLMDMDESDPLLIKLNQVVARYDARVERFASQNENNRSHMSSSSSTPASHAPSSSSSSSSARVTKNDDYENGAVMVYRTGYASMQSLAECSDDWLYVGAVPVHDYRVYFELMMAFTCYSRGWNQNEATKRLYADLQDRDWVRTFEDRDFFHTRNTAQTYTLQYPFEGGMCSSMEAGLLTDLTPLLRGAKFASSLPRSFMIDHMRLIESTTERCSMNVKNHGYHANLCFFGDNIYTYTRAGQMRCIAGSDRRPLVIPLTAELANTSRGSASIGGTVCATDTTTTTTTTRSASSVAPCFMVDSEFTMQDRGEYIDAVFHLFPLVLADGRMRQEITHPSKSRVGMDVQPNFIIDDQHTACDALGETIARAMRRIPESGSGDYPYLTLATESGKPVRLYIVSKQWFWSLSDMRSCLHGNLQLYNDDPCFPYEYLHHPKHEWLSGPVDGRIFNLLGEPGAVPCDNECRPMDMMDSVVSLSMFTTNSVRGKLVRKIPSASDVVVTRRGPLSNAEQQLKFQRDPSYVCRARIVKSKRVSTLDLRITATLINRQLLLEMPPPPTHSDTSERMSVRYMLACLSTITDNQLRGVRTENVVCAETTSHRQDQNRETNVDQYIGIGMAHTPHMETELWTRVVVQGESVIVECALLDGTFRILNFRNEKAEPNHITSVLPTILQAAGTSKLVQTF